MRFGTVTVAILLAVASRGYGRPRDPDPLDSSAQEVTGATLGAATHANGSPDSRPDRPRELKDIQNMDQSLRTVATQLLNSTKPEDLIRIPEEKIVTIETPMQVVHISTRVEDAINDSNNNNNEDDSTKMKFGIPVNSKFGHFEITNPGHAMAMTDEEIEREMATAPTPEQKQPTTPSLLSTWIQLYPLSSTTEGNNVSQVKIDIQSNQIPSTTSTKLPSSIIRQTTANTKPIRKTETKPTTVLTEKPTELPLSTKVTKNVSSSSTPNFIKISTTTSTTSIENDIEETEPTEKKNQQSAPTTTTIKSPTKKSSNKNSTTPKLKLSTPKNSTNKSPKPNQSSNRIKPFSTRRPTSNKNDTVTSTSKIEKVTLKPFSTLSMNRTESTDKPMFITKIKASLLTDNQKATTPASTTIKSVHTLLSKSNFSESANMKVPNPTRVNNVLKVHLKKPSDDTTKIEIQPIRVNPPVLTIEKIGDTSSDQKTDSEDPDVLKNSKIDVKFDFNSEVSKVEIQTQPSDDISLFSTMTSTTKKPRSSSKRKKNKNRRRKTSTTSTTAATTNVSSDDESSTSMDSLNIDNLQVTGIQESKIEPESKAPPSKKKKPSQQTQIKPISTQIYNFISREVMPSVGMVSLVGIGLGLASYFLYPFGGVIARRNYDVEPNYKYNIDEYGGNYGLSEEEVLSKVYSGMTGGQNHQTKYRPGEKNPNYYRYTASEQPQHQQSTRYPNPPVKNHGNRVIYRPVETTAYDSSYRNTEFKYPEVPTTPNYYERQRQQQATDFVPTVGKTGLGNNRQFVVGNIPKEYSSEEADKVPEIVTMQDKVEQKLQYRADENYANDNLQSSLQLAPSMEIMGSPAALVSKVDEEQSAGVFEDVKITPSGSVIEHGPRSLKFDDESEIKSTEPKAIRRKRGILPDLASSFIPMIKGLKTQRKERNSVIQVIPSKSEIEKEKREEEQEEDLSNEILDIIDEALPGKHQNKKHGEKDHTSAATKQHSKASTITTATKSTTMPSTTSSSTTSKTNEKQTATTTTTTTTTTTWSTPTEPDFIDQGETTLDWREYVSTTTKPPNQESGGIDIIKIAKRIAEIKWRLGLTIIKHASEGLARYIGHIQKRFNGEE